MSGLIFITTSAVRTCNLPAQVVVTKTRRGQVRVAPRKAGTKMLKEQFCAVDFVDLFDRGVIVAFREMPDHLKGNYPEAPAADAAPVAPAADAEATA
jgi:hypothetical protein